MEAILILGVVFLALVLFWVFVKQSKAVPPPPAPPPANPPRGGGELSE